MKEDNSETETTLFPTEKEMNEMYRNAWLNYHADAQEAKQELDRRYAKMVNTFGTYKKMPVGMKELLKQDYAAHKIKWSENGLEMQKRFGINEPDPTAKRQEMQSKEETPKKEEFLQNMMQERLRQDKQNSFDRSIN